MVHTLQTLNISISPFCHTTVICITLNGNLIFFLVYNFINIVISTDFQLVLIFYSFKLDHVN